ncbi:type IV pilus assembly protein PilX [Steroidobacter denitrificans]|uniref:Type IV pilus assembly protein PilX n=1 Tax=Steroidobacter denitrificans TaxID=465721 RepID=A0A127FA26_STEDE|nr:PilX N-terminal domain-containing pilus assembly protein [Steroidobacter denitrificans]AMN47267.1 type IV pilus assembly protein PilX [Steroidobacter denitrificans]
MNRSTILSTSPTSQQGTVLVVSLLVLLVMTILALSASQATRMQERMAGATRDMDVAFQASEAGLRNSEEMLDQLSVQPDPCSSPGCQVYQIDVLPADLRYLDKNWWDSHGRIFMEGEDNLDIVHEQPQAVVEELAFVPDSLTVGQGAPTGKTYYRVTSRGFGATDKAESVLQSTYTRRFQ